MRLDSRRAYRRRMARAKIGRRNPPRRWNDRKGRPTLGERRSRLDLVEQWDRNPFVLEGFFGEDFYPDDFEDRRDFDEELNFPYDAVHRPRVSLDIQDVLDELLDSSDFDDLPRFDEHDYL